MISPSKRIAEITESETLAITKKARELKESGVDVISLSIGEPDFDTPENICKAADRAMADGFTHYPPVLGLIEFRQSICNKLKRDNNLDYKPSQVIVSTGAKHSIINAVLSLVDPGDEVIIPAPFWVSYPTMVDYAGGTVVEIPTTLENDYKPTAAQIRAAITPKTKLFIFSNPTNPSGSVWNLQDLEAVASVLREHPQIFVISDEIYEKINYTGDYHSFATLPGMYERTATVNGLAKGYAMTGWRIGYLAGPEWLVAACEKVQGLFTSGANSIAQKAGVEALDGDQSSVTAMKASFDRRRALVAQKLGAIKDLKFAMPHGAFYFFPDVSAFLGKSYKGRKIEDAPALCMYLMEEGGVAVVSGKAFGNPECIRISYAIKSEQLSIALDRLKAALEKLE